MRSERLKPKGLSYELSCPLEDWIKSSNPAWSTGMFAFPLWLCSCVGRGVAKDWSSIQRVLPTVCMIQNFGLNTSEDRLRAWYVKGVRRRRTRRRRRRRRTGNLSLLNFCRWITSLVTSPWTLGTTLRMGNWVIKSLRRKKMQAYIHPCWKPWSQS
jgi:hypothetical protein